MSSSLPTGFKDLPVSKGLAISTIIIPLVASLSNMKYLFYYAYDPFLIQYKQFWRLFTFQIAFLNESEVLLGIVLLYQFRSLERLFGSHKFISIIIVLYGYIIFITSIIATLNFYTGLKWINFMSSGPTGIILGIFFHFKEFIPIMYKFEIYGIGNNKLILNDHAFIHLIIFQLSISQGWKSIGSGLLGWIIGGLVCRGVIPGKQWKLPFWNSIQFKRSNPTNLRSNSPPIDPQNLGNTEQNNSDNNNIDDDDATETRPLASQFLDTFRRS
ncbi:UBA domain-containing protein [Wickerhamomyces ciferrii]|uniref:UBA domain-containing protein n=1 Tax=Wickerhamomyces ciferrii (strain ATCC 14091 / BCRC 22168 / CBS 111 / JCM 3599 / NBRC 0793 / NRRL Y-1031 F-60-10) TaxID=1206466 RepID=K0KLI0_WICCF|nr:UBA domain-containing protein [Wickerhamomyces ciferrii]CCH41978.1 UBA domain-containing protein [Wickerhamomyces ciferrii]